MDSTERLTIEGEINVTTSGSSKVAEMVVFGVTVVTIVRAAETPDSEMKKLVKDAFAKGLRKTAGG